MKPRAFLATAVVVGVITVEIIAVSVTAQESDGVSVPHLTNGKPDFSGVWWSGGIGMEENTLDELERLYTPEARTRMGQLTENDDPTLRCIPFGYPRAMTLPSTQQFQIVQVPGLMVILNEYFHSFRVIPTDARDHPDDIYPTYLGDSVGRWDGDTLVVDITGFNGQIWLADSTDKPTPTSTGGWFTSDALHVVERWRRIDIDTLEYQATVEDANVLSGPWTTPRITVKRAPNGRLTEAMCLDTTTYGLTEKGQEEAATAQ